MYGVRGGCSDHVGILRGSVQDGQYGVFREACLALLCEAERCRAVGPATGAKENTGSLVCSRPLNTRTRQHGLPTWEQHKPPRVDTVKPGVALGTLCEQSTHGLAEKRKAVARYAVRDGFRVGRPFRLSKTDTDGLFIAGL